MMFIFFLIFCFYRMFYVIITSSNVLLLNAVYVILVVSSNYRLRSYEICICHYIGNQVFSSRQRFQLICPVTHKTAGARTHPVSYSIAQPLSISSHILFSPPPFHFDLYPPTYYENNRVSTKDQPRQVEAEGNLRKLTSGDHKLPTWTRDCE